jgi:acyl carrier protein
MEQREIYDRLQKIFGDVFDDESIVVTPTLTARDVEEWDSLNHIRLVIAVQKSFGIKITGAQTAKFKNVGELAELISSKTSVK